MGTSGEVYRPTAATRAGVDRQLASQFRTLEQMYGQGLLGPDPEITIGMELELNIVDSQGQPGHGLNLALQRRLADPRVVVELGSWQLELNLTPVSIAGRPFTALEAEIAQLLNKIRGKLPRGTELTLIGTLPTLTPTHLTMAGVTQRNRYGLMNAGLWAGVRPEQLSIPGPNGSTPTEVNTVALEASCTSVQGHLKVPINQFVSAWNTALATAGIVMAVGVNAPWWLGRPAISDVRQLVFNAATRGRADWNNGYIRHPLDPFATAADTGRYPVLLHPDDREDSLAVLAAGNVPELATLKTQNGSVWPMIVRCVYDSSSDRPHLRLELRYPSAEPTAADNLANNAFSFGLILAPEIATIWQRLPYKYALENLQAAAYQGLKANLWWPGDRGIVRYPAASLAHQLLPSAQRGLLAAGVDRTEAKRLLDIIRSRLASRQTGASWQLDRWYHLRSQGLNEAAATAQTFHDYRRHANGGLGRPVGQWPSPKS